MTSLKKKLLLILGISIIVLAMAYCGVSAFFFRHFFPNTVINGVDASGRTAEAAQERLEEEIARFTLVIEGRNGRNETIIGADVGLRPIYGTAIQDKLEAQNGFLWIFSLWNVDYSQMERVLSYDEAKLKEVAERMECLNEAIMEQPENAYISEYDNGYSIVPEKMGTWINRERFYEVLDDAIMNLENKVDLDEENCYVNPEYTSESEKLQSALGTLNKYAGAKVIYDYGETVDGEIISTFLSVDENFEVSIDRDAVFECVRQMASKHNTIFGKRTFMTSYGKEVKITDGDYGWWMNKEAETTRLIEDIMSGETVNRDAVYLQQAASHEGNDYGDTYVEINLTAQHLFVYVDGELAMETDVVTGNITRHNGTPVGVYGITYKERDAVLRGEDYETPVSYWMPFNGNVGLHDANWRKQFGGDIYKKSGSHGCVNMPPEKAKELFSLIEKGDPVIVYELAGTEPEETAEH